MHAALVTFHSTTSKTFGPRGRGVLVHGWSGVLEIKVGEQHLIAPPMYGIWIPPSIERNPLILSSYPQSLVFVADELVSALPVQACTLRLGFLARALLQYLRLHHATTPNLEKSRLLHVLLDQLQVSAPEGSYLPHAADPLLASALDSLGGVPDEARSIAKIAAALGTTERTLSRRCRRELGMSFSEWRQRLKVISALPRLQSGQPVESIARAIGYSTTSGFIAMFRRATGATPEDFR